MLKAEAKKVAAAVRAKVIKKAKTGKKTKLTGLSLSTLKNKVKKAKAKLKKTKIFTQNWY